MSTARARWVVDASVAAKWLAPEPDADTAATLLDDELLAPDLLYAEVANILWKKQQRAEAPAEAAWLGARWLLSVPFEVTPCRELLESATALSRRLACPAHDCFYLALAVRAGCALVTADRRLAARCAQPDAGGLQPRVTPLSALPAAGPRR